MSQLPALRQQQRSNISVFLCHLERQGTPWSTMAPQPGEYRPALLEQVVNNAIALHGLQGGTRSALNTAFGLGLQGPGGVVRLVPIFPEHQALMSQLPAQLVQRQRSDISYFLCHLEQQGTPWSTMAPQRGESRPALLEQAVNNGIALHGLHFSTRSAINVAFGLALRPPGAPAPMPLPAASSTTSAQANYGPAPSLQRRLHLAPVFPEHRTLMTQLPESLTTVQRSLIRRFLCNLERQGTSWLIMAPHVGELRPALLEQAVNNGIAHDGLQTATRAALNRAFGLTLQPASGIVRLVPAVAEHQTLMSQLPPLGQTQRNRISRFLCHLEQQGTLWSTIAPQRGETRPALLEQAVNDAITLHGIQVGTRSALNNAFGLALQGPGRRVASSAAGAGGQ